LLIESGDTLNFVAAAEIPPGAFFELIWFTKVPTRDFTSSEYRFSCPSFCEAFSLTFVIVAASDGYLPSKIWFEEWCQFAISLTMPHLISAIGPHRPASSSLNAWVHARRTGRRISSFFHSRLQDRGRETQCNGGPIFATHFPTQPFQGCDNVIPLHFRELAQLLLQLLLRVRRLNHVAKLAHIPRPRIAFDLVDTLARNTFVGLPIFSEKSSTNLQARIGASPSRLRSGGN
jgi:hypothetical protein